MSTPKTKVFFTCCNFAAFGFRQTIRIDGVIWNVAKCPKCGKWHQLSKWEKPSR